MPKLLSQKTSTFMSHLIEFRKILIRSIWGWFICFCICYFFSERIFNFLIHPVVHLLPTSDNNLYFTSILSPFMTYARAALVASLFFAFPYILYQIWSFVSPALHTREKKYVLPFMIMGSLLFISGGCFSYFVAFPFGFKALLSFAGPNVKPMLTINEYLDIITQLLVAFGFVFETPLIIVFLSMAGIIRARFFLTKWRYAIVIITIACAIIAPPDVVSLFVMTIPCLVLYFAGAIAALILENRRGGVVPPE